MKEERSGKRLLKERSRIRRAVYIHKKGFACTNHILYCPDLTKVDRSRLFYLSCSRHNLIYKIDLAKQSQEFIADFPKGCKET